MNRRQFFETAAAFTGGALALGLAGCTSSEDDASPDASSDAAPLLATAGVQLYTVRDLLAEDFEGTLRRIAEMGYDEVEFAGYYDRTPQDVRALVDDLGLAAPSAHVRLQDIRERPDALIAAANAIGHTYLVCPYLQDSDRETLDDYRQVAATLEGFRTQCEPEGITVGYHNHDFEFEAMDGQLPYDVLLDETEVVMELDLYWIAKAGHDPVAYFEQYPDRFPLLHLKDLDAAGQMAPVGSGTLDFPGLLEAARDAGFRHGFVEHDNPSDPMASIEMSLTYLSGGAA